MGRLLSLRGAANPLRDYGIRCLSAINSLL
jgi:hypothetical protein